jgi:2-dehydro-3-deoxygluconokinase
MDVVALGECMAQLVPSDGRSVAEAEEFVLSHAGAESNVALALARYGHNVAWVSRLGADALGHRIRRSLGAEGIDLSAVTTERNSPTALYIKDPQPGGSRVTYYRAGSAASRMDETDATRAVELHPKVLHLSGITPALSSSCARCVDVAIRAIHADHGTISFDVNYRPALWPDVETAARTLADIAGRCDIVFVGLDEAATLWHTATPDDVRAALPDATELIVKDGSNEAVSFSGANRVSVPAPRVRVVEAVGAGDAFAAGWLHALLDGGSQEERLRSGHAAAASALGSVTDFAVSRPGA